MTQTMLAALKRNHYFVDGNPKGTGDRLFLF